MKRFHHLSTAFFLMLVLALSARAGDMETTFVPHQPESPTVNQMETTQNNEFSSDDRTLTETVWQLLRSILSLN